MGEYLITGLRRWDPVAFSYDPVKRNRRICLIGLACTAIPDVLCFAAESNTATAVPRLPDVAVGVKTNVVKAHLRVVVRRASEVGLVVDHEVESIGERGRV